MGKLSLLLLVSISVGIGCSLPTPTPTDMPTPTPLPLFRSPIFRIESTVAPAIRALEDTHGKNVWGFNILYSKNLTELTLLACVDEELGPASIRKVAEDLADLAMDADANANRWYYVQIHRCDKDLHDSPSQIRQSDCHRTIAYVGVAGNNNQAFPDGKLKRSRGSGGVTGHCRGS